MKYTNIYITLLFSSLFLISCKKYVDIPPPQNQLVSELVFENDNTADATVAGMYSIMNAYNGQLNVNGSILPAFSADNMNFGLSTADYVEFEDNELSSGNSRINSFWEGPYSLIYHANAVLEGLATSTKVSAAAKKQLSGEAKFVRAFLYFYLINYFGDVPLILNTDYKVNTLLPREKKEKVYEAIIKDLTDAQSDLSNTYIGSERIRPNKAAATTLLARTYLFLGQWDKAETEATKVITDPLYQIETNLNSVFLRTSKEAIWQLQTVNTSTTGVNTWEGFSIVPPSPTSRGYYNITNNLLSAFETGDKRKTDWVNTYSYSGNTYYYPYKYKIRTAASVTEYSTVLRLAELYLIRAEARAQQDKLSLSKDDLDIIRIRSNLPVLSTMLTKEQTLLAVEKERRVELFAEWGHRWFDLRRTGRALTILTPLKPGIAATGLYYPIPLPAINTNPNLVQNPGY